MSRPLDDFDDADVRAAALMSRQLRGRQDGHTFAAKPGSTWDRGIRVLCAIGAYEAQTITAPAGESIIDGYLIFRVSKRRRART